MNLLRGWRGRLALVLLVALSLRCGAAVWLEWFLEARGGEEFLFGDSLSYWVLAEQLLQGGPYEYGAADARVLRVPGFPFLLAAIFRLVGTSHLMVRLVLAAVGTGACALVFVLGRRLFDERTGLLAAAGAAVYPAFVLFSPVVLSETLFAALMLANLVLLGHALGLCGATEAPAGRRGDWLALVVGVAAGAATLVRPSWIAFCPLVALVRLAAGLERRRSLWRAAIMMVGMVMALAPWWIRNYRVTGRFVPTTLWVGASLYDGLNPRATGASDMYFLPAVRRMYVDEEVREREYLRDRYLRRQAFEFARDNPKRVLELAGLKFLRFWHVWPNAERFRWWPIRLGYLVTYVPVIALAAAGFWSQRRRGGTVALLVLPIVYFCVIHLVFVSSIRYRLPGMFPVMVLAAAALVRPASQEQDAAG